MERKIEQGKEKEKGMNGVTRVPVEVQLRDGSTNNKNTNIFNPPTPPRGRIGNELDNPVESPKSDQMKVSTGVVPPQDSGKREQLTLIADALLDVWNHLYPNQTDTVEIACMEKVKCFEGVEAIFPVYGAVNAGKSTILSSLLRERVLPAQVLPMTSIPTKITHKTGVRKHLQLKQAAKWNTCVRSYRQRLFAGTLKIRQQTTEMKLYETEERIRRNTVHFPDIIEEDGVSEGLETLAHFARLLWINDIDFETEFDISLDIPDLPELWMDLTIFREFADKPFTLLDTSGPYEAKAKPTLLRSLVWKK
jgi:hypothetical protein